MLIISGVIEVNPDNTEAAYAAMATVMEATQKEAGCLIYEFSQGVGAPHRFRVYEEWENGASLKAHSEAAHIAEFREALAKVGVVSRELFLIKGGEKKPL